jgi:hypothetical protein
MEELRRVTRPRAADDFVTIRSRIEELRRERAQAAAGNNLPRFSAAALCRQRPPDTGGSAGGIAGDAPGGDHGQDGITGRALAPDNQRPSLRDNPVYRVRNEQRRCYRFAVLDVVTRPSPRRLLRCTQDKIIGEFQSCLEYR